MNFIQQLAIYVLPLIFAITIHEVAHGWVASWCGDQTARLSGRLTLNPIHHIDLIGTIVVPLLTLLTTGLVFGWAKPVPVDARNMNKPRRDMALVAAAGPLSNLLMAVFWGAVAWFGLYLNSIEYQWLGLPLALMGGAGMNINVWLGLLNLIPLPPLDGGRLMVCLLPPKLGYRLSLIEPYSLFILIFLLATGVLSSVLWPFFRFTLGCVAAIFGL